MTGDWIGRLKYNDEVGVDGWTLSRWCAQTVDAGCLINFFRGQKYFPTEETAYLLLVCRSKSDRVARKIQEKIQHPPVKPESPTAKPKIT
jgi:hypothetical protein